MAIISGTDVLKQLCDEWGLKGSIRKITIEMEYDDVATISVLYYMKEEQTKALAVWTRKYDLVERKDNGKN